MAAEAVKPHPQEELPFDPVEDHSFLRVRKHDSFMKNAAGDVMLHSSLLVELQKHLKRTGEVVEQTGSHLRMASKPSPFFKLPREIRDIIYSYALDTVAVHRSVKGFKTAGKDTAKFKFFCRQLDINGRFHECDPFNLVRICRTIRSELWSSVGYVIPALNFGARWQDMVAFLRQMDQKGLSRLVHKVEFLMPNARVYANMDLSLPSFDAANVATAVFELARLVVPRPDQDINYEQVEQANRTLDAVLLNPSCLASKESLFRGSPLPLIQERPVLTLSVPSTEHRHGLIALQMAMWQLGIALKYVISGPQETMKLQGTEEAGIAEGDETPLLVSCTWLRCSQTETTSERHPIDFYPSGGDLIHYTCDAIENFIPSLPLSDKKVFDRIKENFSIWIGTQVGAANWSALRFQDSPVALVCPSELSGQGNESFAEPIPVCICHTLPLSLGRADMHGLRPWDYNTLERRMALGKTGAHPKVVKSFKCESPPSPFDAPVPSINPAMWPEEYQFALLTQRLSEIGAHVNPALFWHGPDEFRNVLLDRGLAEDISKRLHETSIETTGEHKPAAQHLFRPHPLNPYYHDSLAAYLDPKPQNGNNLEVWLDIDQAKGSERLRAVKNDHHVKSRVEKFYENDYPLDEILDASDVSEALGIARLSSSALQLPASCPLWPVRLNIQTPLPFNNATWGPTLQGMGARRSRFAF